MKRQPPRQPSRQPSSWEGVNKWYDGLVGETGHYYHKQVIFPNLKTMLPLKEGDKLLDLACGNGVLSTIFPKKAGYLGVDISKSLIKEAKTAFPERTFLVGDITKPLDVDNTFTHAVCLLALQNIDNPKALFDNAARHLVSGGRFALVINHPYFRIPRQTHWGVDDAKKLQYRRVDSYMSPMKIPIQAHPGRGNTSPSTLSFHTPLHQLTKWLHEAGFVIDYIDEWCSDKTSEGGRAKMENRARSEIPLFMALICRRQ